MHLKTQNDAKLVFTSQNIIDTFTSVAHSIVQNIDLSPLAAHYAVSRNIQRSWKSMFLEQGSGNTKTGRVLFIVEIMTYNYRH